MRKIVVSLLILLFCWGAAAAAVADTNSDVVQLGREDITYYVPVGVKAPAAIESPVVIVEPSNIAVSLGVFTIVLVLIIWLTVIVFYLHKIHNRLLRSCKIWDGIISSLGKSAEKPAAASPPEQDAQGTAGGWE
jgi:hypothetical protein